MHMPEVRIEMAKRAYKSDNSNLLKLALEFPGAVSESFVFC